MCTVYTRAMSDVHKLGLTNTAKFLIGISPQGAITFISKGWGGRVSDVHLTENCGILENLLPGDLILTERGFNINDSAGMYLAKVKLPPFTRGKKQLSKSQVDLSRQLSRVRIHVERVIGVVRQKYSILSSYFIMCVLKMKELVLLIKLSQFVVLFVTAVIQLFN